MYKSMMVKFIHLAIDVTCEWADPNLEDGYGTEHTKDVAQKIANTLPLFREADVQNIVIYYEDEFEPEGFEIAGGGPYLVSAEEPDILLPKYKDSGFGGNSQLPALLAELNCPNLVVTGFDAGGCILRTVRDALERGFNVTLLIDLIGQSQNLESDIPEYIDMMVSRGAIATTSKDFFLEQGYILNQGNHITPLCHVEHSAETFEL